MATISYVVNAVDSASATFARIAGSADELNNQLDDLSHKTATARVGLQGDKEANLALDKIDFKMARLAKRVAEGKVGVEGEARALLEIRTLEAALDKFGRKDVTASVHVDVDKHGFLGGLFGGGAAGIGRAIPGLGGLLSTPQAAIAALIAGLATLPFAAAAAAGGIVAALGGGMTAVGIIAASKNKQVAKSFTDLKASATKDLREISVPFQSALKSIASTAQSVLPRVMGALGDAFKSMAGPLKSFSDTLIRSLASPSVLRAIRDLGGAFGAVLKALRPSLPSIINQIADGIDGIAQAIRAHPRIFADLINFLGHLVGWSLQAIGALTRVAAWIVQFTRDVGHWLHTAYDLFLNFFRDTGRNAGVFRDTVARIWDTIWRNTVTRASNGVKAVGNMFRSMWHDIAVIFDNIRHAVANVWDTIWRNTVTRAQHGVSDVIGWVKTMPGRAVSALWGFGHRLAAFAHDAFTEMWNAIKNVGGSIWHWLTGWVSRLPGWLKHLLGIHSPSSVFYDIGKQMMMGLFHGIKDHAQQARSAAWDATNINFNPGAGVMQWGPLVRRALLMEHLNPLLAARVLYQMQTESGGNPNIVNTWDSNAQAGTPSMGLMQVIGPTFSAYHWPGTSWNILNPLANIAAALNYARHRYGPTLMSGGMGIGSGHGYALGGVITEPIWGIGASGQRYTFGERGPETVIPGTGRGGGNTYNINVGVLPGGEREAGRRIVQAIRRYEQGSGKGWRS